MRVVDIIEKKRDNKELKKEEISFLLKNYLKNEIPDYQLSAFLMAVYFNDMTDEELLNFTNEMKNSGDIIEFKNKNKFLVDKHSTGGVGDKVTIALAPILAALDMGTAKLSGKGLGHTGGTIDKFESIKGFKFSNTKEELIDISNKTGIGLMGYSDKIVPLDKKIYALRDVTATVPSIPLIASSIMSKKLALESDLIILDVKVGDGAFMKNLDDAKELSKRMLKLGCGFNRDIKIVLSNMDEPLGHNIGNSLEIEEAIDILKGQGPEDLKEIIYAIVYLALKSKDGISDYNKATKIIDNVINDGSALKKLEEFINESNGNGNLVYDYSLLPQAKNTLSVFSENEGYVLKIKTEEIGKAAMIIGAGRSLKDDVIDHAVGIKLLKKVADKVEKGEKIAEILYNDDKNIENSLKMLKESYVIGYKKPEKSKVVLEIIE